MSTQQPPTKKIKMFSSESLVNAIPYEVWRDIICPKLGYSDRLNLNATCNEFVDTFGDYKQKFLKKHAIHVPQDVRTIEKAMELVAKLQLIPTEKDPLRIVLDEGVHEIKGDYRKAMRVAESHITFVGKGKDQTTILGGFYVVNRYVKRGGICVFIRRNIKFEALTIMNPDVNGIGLVLDDSTVEVLNCVVKHCWATGMSVDGNATVTATNCEFMENTMKGVFCGDAKLILNDCQIHHNGWNGLTASRNAVVDIHGTKTDIHANKEYCIYAMRNAWVNIHLPWIRTVGDTQKQVDGGSVANMNDDGTFTHVMEVEEEHDY